MQKKVNNNMFQQAPKYFSDNNINQDIFQTPSLPKISQKMISCSICLQKVPSNQLVQHENECRSNNFSTKKQSKIKGGGGALQKTSFNYSKPEPRQPPPEEPPKMIQRPISLMCYICGREFGTKSLKIHIKSCKEKWPLTSNRPLPREPPGLMELLSKDNITRRDIDIYNNRAYDQYNYDVLVPCANCGRTFKPDSLTAHQKGCKPGNVLKGMSEAQKEYQQEFQFAMQNGNQTLVPCSKCGRKFASERIQKHQQVCKPGPTKQALKKQKIMEQKNLQLEKFKQKLELQKPKENDWRKQHEEFQQALMAMRQGNKMPQQQQNYYQTKSQGMQKSIPQKSIQQKSILQKQIPQKNVQQNMRSASQKPNPTYKKQPFQSQFQEEEDNIYGGGSAFSQQNNKYQRSNDNNPFSTKTNLRGGGGGMSGAGNYKSSNVKISNGRDGWIYNMSGKQLQVHNNLYGIGEYKPLGGNDALFPAPKR